MIQCQTCGWEYDGFYDKDASYQGQKHANETGHKVHREIGRSIIYYPRGEKSK